MIQNIKQLVLLLTITMGTAYSGSNPLENLPATGPGSLDRTFGADGLVRSTYPNSAFNAIALQSNGGIVTAGKAFNRLAVAWFTNQGAIRFLLSFAFPSNSEANAIAIDSQGNIIAAGYSGPNCALARYTSDGQTLGTTTTSFGPETISKANALAIDSANRIYVGGFVQYPPQPGQQGLPVARFFANGNLDTPFGKPRQGTQSKRSFALARYLPNGQLDLSFGLNNDGKVIYDFPSSSSSEINGLYLARGNTIDVVGVATINGIERFAATRFNTNGSVVSSTVGNYRGKAYAITDANQSTASWVAGTAQGTSSTNTGSLLAYLDIGFNITKYTLQPITNPPVLFGNAYAVSVYPSLNTIPAVNRTKVVTAGDIGYGGPTYFNIKRFNVNGSIDTTFGELVNPLIASGPRTGNVITLFNEHNAVAKGVAIQTDGRIVAAGYTTDAQGNVLQGVIARYNS